VKRVIILVQSIEHAEWVRNKVKRLENLLCKFITVIGRVIDELFSVKQQRNDTDRKKKI
jgi:hypothetical protein